MTSEQGRSMGQMVWGHQHRRPYPVKTESNMATHYMTYDVGFQNTTVYITKI